MIRAALVTGAARGIGRAVAATLAGRGWNLLLVDIDRRGGEAAAAELARDHPEGDFIAHHADVAAEEEVREAVAVAGKRFGHLDGLVNNAAIATPDAGPPEQLPLETWNRVIAVNLTGPFLMSRHAAELLRRPRGAVVNIASTRAFQSEPHTEAYAASKGGLVSLTHALAVSLGPEIRVNSVSPGWIDTHPGRAPGATSFRSIDHTQHPAGRVGLPGDVAALVAHLLSEDAAFITGQNFTVDGGMTRKMIYVE